MRPLDGITVLAVEHAVAGPFCTRQLADLGARVIKIERPKTGDYLRHLDNRFDGLSSHFVWLNRSKESLTLNLKKKESKDILEKLLSKVDVLVQNLAPGSCERLGLSYKVLSKKFPEIIVCNISGYGSNGPYRDKRAYDLLIQGESGLISVTGNEKAKVKSGHPVVDISAGMYAYSNILAALLQRNKSGKGCEIDVSMFESMVEWMTFPLNYAYKGAGSPKRTGASHPTIYPYGDFLTGDGKKIMFGLQNEREWSRFCEHVLMKPEIADDDRFNTNIKRNSNRKALSDIICNEFNNLSSEKIIERLDNAKIANARINEMKDIWAHEQLKYRNRWKKVLSSVGEIPALLPPGESSAWNPRMDPIPDIGEQTNVILKELGYSNEKIKLFRKLEVI